MQNTISRFSRWWVSQFNGQGCLGKSVFIGFTLGIVFFVCMSGFVLLSVVASPFLPDPTATMQQVNADDAIESAAVENNRSNTIAVVETVPATAAIKILPTSTDQPTIPPTSMPATATIKPSPTSPPVRAATVVMLTVEASETNTPTKTPPTSTAVVLPTSTQQVAPTAVPPTAPPSTALPTVPSPTAILPTAVAQPTATLPTATGSLIIIGVNKQAEYVDIRNDGGAAVDLNGWTLRSEKGPQDCALGGVIGPGETLRIWAMAESAGQGGFNCGFGSNIWNNSESDPAVLINPSGQEVSRR